MLPDSNICTGCGVCICVCPTKCISFVEDKEGFRQIEIHTDICIHCGKCERSCPVLEDRDNSINNRPTDYIKVFACWNKDKKIRKESSSGGFFPALADIFLEQDASIVYGAAMQSDLSVSHISVSHKTDLSKIRGSKYLQSHVSHLFPSVKQQLEEGQKILFSGTPCQIGALYKYLRKDYENLYTCEVICHGVPSSLFFSKYIEFLKKRYHTHVSHVSFRDKFIGWTIPISKYLFENKKVKGFRAVENPFMYFFYAGLNLRRSCYHCRYSSLPRIADITMGDFWGIGLTEKVNFLEKEKGISLILLNNLKGDFLFNKVSGKVNYEQRSLKEAIKGNEHLIKPVNLNSIFQLREKVFHELQTNGVEKIIDKCLPLSPRGKMSLYLGTFGMKIYFYLKNIHRIIQ